MKELEAIKTALAEYREADKTGMDLAIKSYRLDRLLHNNAEELVRLAEIGEAVELHYECEGLSDDAVASICDHHAKEPTC